MRRTIAAAKLLNTDGAFHRALASCHTSLQPHVTHCAAQPSTSGRGAHAAPTPIWRWGQAGSPYHRVRRRHQAGHAMMQGGMQPPHSAFNHNGCLHPSCTSGSGVSRRQRSRQLAPRGQPMAPNLRLPGPHGRHRPWRPCTRRAPRRTATTLYRRSRCCFAVHPRRERRARARAGRVAAQLLR